MESFWEKFWHRCKNILLVFLAIGIVVGITIGIQSRAQAESATEILTGQVHNQTLSIIAPVSGQITSLSYSVGQTVHQGDIIATIQMLNAQDGSLILNSDLYQISGTTVQVISPVNGIVANEPYAAQSAINTGNQFIAIYPYVNVEVDIFLPLSTSPTSFSHFYAVMSDGTKHELVNLRQVPSNDPAFPTDSNVYASNFASLQGATSGIDLKGVQIVAVTKNTVTSPFAFPSFSSLFPQKH